MKLVSSRHGTGKALVAGLQKHSDGVFQVMEWNTWHCVSSGWRVGTELMSPSLVVSVPQVKQEWLSRKIPSTVPKAYKAAPPIGRNERNHVPKTG
jgi:hypothetical protein